MFNTKTVNGFSDGDFNNDQLVDVYDFGIQLKNYGR